METDDGRTIILDGGTGIYPLSQTLARRMPLACTIFITHTHWDHIQGLPFFIPFFVQGNTLMIYGGSDPILQRDIGEVLRRQMEYSYFPVRRRNSRPRCGTGPSARGQTVEVGAARVTAVLMNHTVLTFGYRIDCNGKSLFFTGGPRTPLQHLRPGGRGLAENENFIAMKNATLARAMQGADILVADSAYTAAEYPSKRGWGHGTGESCIEMAARRGSARSGSPTMSPSGATTNSTSSPRGSGETIGGRRCRLRRPWPTRASRSHGDYFFGRKTRSMKTIKIKGMSCHHCVMAVTKVLVGIDGIRDVKVDLEKGEASYTQEKPVDEALIRERIAKAGFKVVD